MKSRKEIFENVKQLQLFAKLNQTQVDGMNAILDEVQRIGYMDQPWIAYILATTYHETAFTMDLSIEEYGKGKGKPYGVPHPSTGKTYYGRGPCQLTWYDNYKRFQDKLEVPLVKNPELACRPDIAVRILFVGMTRGMFTGKKLQDYFNRTTEDWVQARRIINVLDKAEQIAGYGKKFLEAIK